jgi:hypothetical protein
MKRPHAMATLAILVVLVLITTLVVQSRFERDLAIAAKRATQNSEMVNTRCGPIEVQLS